MNKVDGKYILKWFGTPTAVMLVLVIIGAAADVALLVVMGIMLWILSMALLPSIILKKQLIKKALEQEKSFSQKGFSYQQKFTSSNGIFYIDAGGRLAIVWKYNPDSLYMADPSKITDIRTNDGKTPAGSYGVCCEFKLEGKKIKIWTLRVSNGYLDMRNPKVLEAISKADKLGELLKNARTNAGSR